MAIIPIKQAVDPMIVDVSDFAMESTQQDIRLL